MVAGDACAISRTRCSLHCNLASHARLQTWALLRPVATHRQRQAAWRHTVRVALVKHGKWRQRHGAPASEWRKIPMLEVTRTPYSKHGSSRRRHAPVEASTIGRCDSPRHERTRPCGDSARYSLQPKSRNPSRQLVHCTASKHCCQVAATKHVERLPVAADQLSTTRRPARHRIIVTREMHALK